MTDATDETSRVAEAIGSTETIETFLSVTAPIERGSDPGRDRVSAAGNVAEADSTATADVVFTDRRILAVDPSDEPVSIPYAAVREAALDDPREPLTLTVTVENGTVWHLAPDSGDAQAAKYAKRLLASACEVWEQVRSAAAAVESAEEELVEPILAGNWSKTSDRYDSLSSRVEEAAVGIRYSPFDDVASLRDRQDGARATLEAAYVTALLVRIEKLYEVGLEWLDEGDLDRGSRAIETARESLNMAQERVETHDLQARRDDQAAEGSVSLDPVPSPIGDEPSIEAALDRAQGRIDSLVQLPIERIDQIRECGSEASDPAEAIDSLEEAFDRYRSLLSLVWSADSVYGIDRSLLQERVETTVGDLIDAHRTLAEDAEEVANEAVDADDIGEAFDAYERAIGHYESAHSLAKEFRTGDPEPLAAALDRVRERRGQLPAGVARKPR